MGKFALIWNIFKNYSKRHWLFTAIAVFWILSPFDDFFLPVIDEVILVLLWAWQAWKEHNNKSIKEKKTYLP